MCFACRLWRRDLPNACTVITVNGCVPHAANNAKNKQQRQRRRHASKNHSKINSKSSATHNKACSKAHQNQNTNQIDESTNQSTTNKSSQNTLAKSKHVQLKSSNQPTSNSKPHPAPFTRTTNKQLATGKTETPRTHQFTNSACTTRVRGPTKPPRGMMTQTKLIGNSRMCLGPDLHAARDTSRAMGFSTSRCSVTLLGDFPQA